MKWFGSYRRIRDLIIIAKGKYKHKIFFTYLYLSIKRKFGLETSLKNGVYIELWAHANIVRFVIKQQLDFDVLWDSMCIDQYEIKLNAEDVEVILDLGSNIGTTIIAFYHKFPNAKIFGFEPDPQNYKRLQENVALLKDQSRVSIFNLAITDKDDAQINFHVADGAHWSSSIRERSIAKKQVLVGSITIDRIMKQNNIEAIDILKMDIEGAESEALDKFTKLNSVRYFIGEIHPTMMKDTISSFLARLSSFEIEYFNSISGVFKVRNKCLNKMS